MKKFSLILSVLLVVALLLPMSISAAEEFYPYNEFGEIKLTNKAPTIDGKIDGSEGWSEKKTMKEGTCGSFDGFNPLTSETDIYFAYTEEGLYFAVDMTEYGAAYTLRFYSPNEAGDLEWVSTRSFIDENAASYSSDNYPEKTPDGRIIDGALVPPSYNEVKWKNEEQTVCAFWTSGGGNTVEYCTGEDGSAYAFDGDVFALSLDMLGVFHQSKMNGNSDYAPQYNVGVFEGNTVQIASTRYNAANITDKCKGAGSINGNKLTFEVMIPWDIIVADQQAAADGFGISHTYTKDEILAGSSSWAAVTLKDRFNDPEAGYVDDWGRNITVCMWCDDVDADGNPVCGLATAGDNIKAYGIKLAIGNTSDNGNGGSGNGETEVVTDANGNVVTDASGNAVTQKAGSSTTKAAGTNGSGKGGSSAGTFDAGIAVAVGALATSAIGVYFSKKKR